MTNHTKTILKSYLVAAILLLCSAVQAQQSTAPDPIHPITCSQLTITDPTGRPTCRIDSTGATFFNAQGIAWCSLSNRGDMPTLILMSGTASVVMMLGPAGAQVSGMDTSGLGFVVDGRGYRPVVPVAGGGR